ncbi:hypothetical protein [Gimesia chilikensis]|uniref:hypothetical protein n=1 Tax=Gimesia chilikensis TaxID=2605989 RepID=UPI003A8EC4FF
MNAMFSFTVKSDAYQSLKNKARLELYDPVDYAPAVISAVCRALYESGAFEFKLCFGDGEEILLPVDCELSIFLEQLPEVISASKNEHVRSFVIHFFEQGFNFDVLVQKKNGLYRVSFDMRDCDHSVHEGYDIEFSHFESMLQEIAQMFVEISLEVFPELSENQALIQWRSEVGIQNGNSGE